MTGYMRKLILIMMLCSALPSKALEPGLQAKTNVKGIDFGLTFDELIDYQTSLPIAPHNFRFGANFLGPSYDYQITDQFSLGVTEFNTLAEVISINANYALSGDPHHGWQLSVDFGHRFQNKVDGFFKSEQGSLVLFSAGYKF